MFDFYLINIEHHIYQDFFLVDNNVKNLYTVGA